MKSQIEFPFGFVIQGHIIASKANENDHYVDLINYFAMQMAD